MSNIILNTDCNRQCVYCFSNGGGKEKKQMSLDTLTTICDFFERSRKRKINVLGGEPTLHPQFDLFLEYLLSRDFVVHVFTNGMLSPTSLEAVNVSIAHRKITHRRLKFIVNVNEEKYRDRQEMERQEQTFDALHSLCSLSFNIFEPSCSLDFLVPLIVEKKLIREIRLGLASPIRGKHNRFLPLKAFRPIARKIDAFSSLCKDNDIDLVFDCGFPLCIFTDKELGKLYRNKTQLKFVCHPIPDIDPDLNVTHCYPLADYFPRKLDRFRDLEDIRSYFRSRLAGGDSGGEKMEKADGKNGIFKTCRECDYRRRGMCSAGCKGHYL